MELAERELAEQEAEAKKNPTCNSKWTQSDGSTIWCENSMSSGASSSLVPRIVDAPGGQRCVCVEVNIAITDTAKYRAYPDCAQASQTCYVRPVVT